MSNEVTNSTPLVTHAQWKTLMEAADVLTHLANEAREDQKVGRAPEGVDKDLDEQAQKLAMLALLLELNGMVSEE